MGRSFLLILLLLAFLLSSCETWKHGQRDELSLLTEIIGTSRPLEARITGGFRYQRYSSNNSRMAQSALLQRLKDGLQFIDRRKLSDNYLLALVNLITGKDDDAISTLESLATQSQYSAEILNTLAIAYQIRATDEHDFANLVHALSLIDEAITASPQLLEAHYNRALILEQVNLKDAARAAWQDYLQLETVTEWRAEAEEHLNKLKDPPRQQSWSDLRSILPNLTGTAREKLIADLIHQSLQNAQLYILDEILPSWAEAYHAGNSIEAAQDFELAVAICHELSAQSQDRLACDAVKAVELARERVDNRAQLELLVNAHITRLAGQQLLRLNDASKASVKIRTARRLFAQAGDYADEAWTAFLNLRWQQDQKKALADLNYIGKIASQHQYKYLSGRVWRGIGAIEGFQFDSSNALKSQETALKYFTDINDNENITMTNFNISEILSQISEKDEIWQYQHEALDRLNRLTSPANKVSILTGIASQWQKFSELRAACYLHNLAVKLARNSNNKVSLIVSLLRRSITLNRLGYRDQTARDISEAKKELDEIADNRVREPLQTEFLYINGLFLLSDNAVAANEIFTQLLTRYKQTNDQYYTTSLYLNRARAYLVMSEIDQAEIDLKRGITVFEEQRAMIASEKQQIDFFEEVNIIYDEMIHLLLDQHRNEEAFNYLEKAKARNLIDKLNSKGINNSSRVDLFNNLPVQSYTIDKIQAELPPQTTIIEYAALGKELYVWLIARDQTKLIKLSENIALVNRLLQELCNKLEKRANNDEIDRISVQLYQILFHPFASVLTRESRVVIIPDKALCAVPFQIFRDASTDRYILQDYLVSYAPSTSTFLYCLKKERSIKTDHDPGILIIGNPTFDRDRFANLDDLKWAKTEAEEIKRLYATNRLTTLPFRFELLIGKTATKKAFWEALDNYEIIHFAGHAIGNTKFQNYSQLIFAKDVNGRQSDIDDTLYAYQIEQRRLFHTHLVVLSACRTAKGQIKIGEGSLSFAQTFLAAGAPAVVASLWGIDDEIASRIFMTFHRELLTGKDVAAALRLAQLAELEHGDNFGKSIVNWGPFILSGSNCSDGILLN